MNFFCWWFLLVKLISVVTCNSCEREHSSRHLVVGSRCPNTFCVSTSCTVSLCLPICLLFFDPFPCLCVIPSLSLSFLLPAVRWPRFVNSFTSNRHSVHRVTGLLAARLRRRRRLVAPPKGRRNPSPCRAVSTPPLRSTSSSKRRVL